MLQSGLEIYQERFFYASLVHGLKPYIKEIELLRYSIMNISSANLPLNEITFQNSLDCSQRKAHTSHVTLKREWRPVT